MTIHENHTQVQTMATYKTHHTMVYKPLFYLWFHTYKHITYVENNRKNYRKTIVLIDCLRYETSCGTIVFSN